MTTFILYLNVSLHQVNKRGFMRITKRGNERQKPQSISLVVVIGIIFGSLLITGPAVHATDYNAEIKQLQAEKDANINNRSSLESTALTLEQKLANLQANIAVLGTEITSNQASQTDLAAKIVTSTEQIKNEQVLLGRLIRQLYIDNDISTLEMLASSKNLSEYVEREQYSLSVQSKVKQSVDRIAALKKEQENQKVLVDKLVADNQSMQRQLSSDQKDSANLLAMNQQQQTEYSKTIVVQSTQITDLQRQQAEENLRFEREQAALAEAARKKAEALAAAQTAARQPVSVPVPEPTPAGIKSIDGHNYPWASASFPNEISDPWGMYLRQCVSYTAWAVAASGRHMPYWGGYGDAKQWDDNARAAGIPVDYNPRPGDVAVSKRGTYGHVMYVDGVNGDGSINISQYNASWTGTYSEARIFPGNLIFIHF